ncbi:MAG: shikimate dehydrogenase [Xanthobacteraceae bacterium]
MNDDLRAACVIGWPVAHSRSPLIHNYWIKRHNLTAQYRREAVPPEKFAGFIATLRERGYIGANVTLPHKEAALALSQPDDRARAVGAANTLWFEGDKLRSTNTDVEGFLENLNAAAPRWDAGLQSCMVLGAGGAARAIVFALIDRGAGRIYLANRTFEKAEALRERFGERVHPVRWEEINGLLAGVQLLVNATSLGMKGQPKLDINIRHLPQSAVVADIVYDPLPTPLLAAAEKRGLRTADGLGMLLHQAVRGFSLWFGVRPEVTGELRALVEADLKTGATAER